MVLESTFYDSFLVIFERFYLGESTQHIFEAIVLLFFEIFPFFVVSFDVIGQNWFLLFKNILEFDFIFVFFSNDFMHKFIFLLFLSFEQIVAF